MPSKKVCMKCISDRELAPWGKSDNDRWKTGWILCPVEKNGWSFNDGRKRLDEPLPKGCPYAFEHALALGANHAE